MYAQGRYWCRIVRAELGESKNNHPQIVIRFTVLGIVDPNNPKAALLACECQDRSIYRVLTTDKAAEWAIRDLRIIGYDKDGFSQLHPEHSQYASMEGVEFEGECKHDTYQGNVQERWFVYDPSGPAVKPLGKAEARKLDAMFGKMFKAAAKPEKKPVQAKPAVEAVAADAPVDDIPF